MRIFKSTALTDIRHTTSIKQAITYQLKKDANCVLSHTYIISLKYFYASVTVSISTSTFLGSVLTATQDLAGLDTKYFA